MLTFGRSQVKPTIDSSHTGYNHTSYTCNGKSGVVQHYHLAKGGHCWPDNKAINFDSAGGTKCKGAKVLGYTPKVLEFFEKWTLRNGPSNGGMKGY